MSTSGKYQVANVHWLFRCARWQHDSWGELLFTSQISQNVEVALKKKKEKKCIDLWLKRSKTCLSWKRNAVWEHDYGTSCFGFVRSFKKHILSTLFSEVFARYTFPFSTKLSWGLWQCWSTLHCFHQNFTWSILIAVFIAQLYVIITVVKSTDKNTFRWTKCGWMCASIATQTIAVVLQHPPIHPFTAYV